MTFKKTEKEILTAIVKYGKGNHSMAMVLNKSRLLEDRGIVIAFYGNSNHVFMDKRLYDFDDANALSYLTELISLIKYLIQNRLITILSTNSETVHVLGRQKARLTKPGYIEVEDAYLEVESDMGNWIDRATHEQTYWPNGYTVQELPLSRYLECSFSISQELKDLVKHNFKTEEQIRFQKQQRLMWISIIVATVIGLCSLIISVISIIIR